MNEADKKWVKTCVAARHSNHLTDEHCEHLFKQDYHVRKALTLNSSIGKEHIENLMKDKDFMIRTHVAFNPAISERQLNYLVNHDKHITVRTKAEEVLQDRLKKRESK